MKSSWYAASCLLAALVWTMALIVDGDPFEPAGVVLIGLGMLSTATVAVIGMIVVEGRWAHRLGLVSLALTAILAIARDIDWIWVAAATISGFSLAVMLGPSLGSRIRGLPSASGPPPKAVLPPLILLVVPAALGFTGNQASAWGLLVVGISAPTAGFLYSRVLPGGLIAVRVVWPILAVALAPVLGWWAGSTSVAAAAVVVMIAWDPAVRASFHPPREVGSILSMPPELTPREALDAAHVDDEGKRI